MITGYIRVSTTKQHPENQKDEIMRFAEANGFKIENWVVEVVSGKKQVQGRKLGRLMKAMKKGDGRKACCGVLTPYVLVAVLCLHKYRKDEPNCRARIVI